MFNKKINDNVMYIFFNMGISLSFLFYVFLIFSMDMKKGQSFVVEQQGLHTATQYAIGEGAIIVTSLVFCLLAFALKSFFYRVCSVTIGLCIMGVSLYFYNESGYVDKIILFEESSLIAIYLFMARVIFSQKNIAYFIIFVLGSAAFLSFSYYIVNDIVRAEMEELLYSIKWDLFAGIILSVILYPILRFCETNIFSKKQL